MVWDRTADDIPEDRLERLRILEGLIASRAQGGQFSEPLYIALRDLFRADKELAPLLPDFVNRYRSEAGLWAFLKSWDPKYAGRQHKLEAAFTPLANFLEGRAGHPGDEPISDTLKAFDAESVHRQWLKALDRRDDDPEGAITIAKTLLENVCQSVIERSGETYEDGDDLPKLWGRAASLLNLAPSQHSEDAFKKILGSAHNMVNGLAEIRNKLGDAHAGRKLPVRPAARHAALAVNLAGTMATFLVETFNARSNEHEVSNG